MPSKPRAGARDRAPQDESRYPDHQRHGQRFNGRVQREVPGITIDSHQDPEPLLAGLTVARDGRRQRALNDLSPEMVLHQRRKDKPVMARDGAKIADPTALDRALKVAAGANEVSRPDS
ncbi:hypothetical protein [Methylobacterium nonmethylotrophicum]|uniref:hypothetical protein n=1 Tax=Methylobacterium nonmethylotrophicum TaxID=1141884 RepID=UPI003CCB105F